jgi:hypothetical protein
MLSKQDFIHHSLHLNLFFLRIIKEHFIFLEASLFPKNKLLRREADLFKNEFEQLLKQTLRLSVGSIDPTELGANEFVTPYTLEAEQITQFATGIPIDMSITSFETALMPHRDSKRTVVLDDEVYKLNERVITAVNAVIKVKFKLLEDVEACKLFTQLYPSLLEHVLEEAVHYLAQLEKLQEGIDIHATSDLINVEAFWNHVMEEHSYFIRGLLDPSEKELFDISNEFANEFEMLTKEASDMTHLSQDLSALTARTIKSVAALRDFKAEATNGLIHCKIKAIILPLLADHVLREANHYLYLLRMSENM